MPKTILVTSCHTRVGYNVACALVRAGWNVIACGRALPTMCAHVPGVVADVGYPDPFGEPEAFLDALRRAARLHGAKIVLPVHEELFVVSRYRARLGNRMRVLAPPFDALLEVHDKGNAPEYAARANVRTPKTVVVKTREDVERAIATIGAPMLVKPRFGSGAQRIRILRTAADLDELEDIDLSAWKDDPAILQEWVPGIGAGVNMLLKGGQIVAISGHQRIREVPIHGGTGSAHVSLTDGAIFDAARRLVRETPLKDGVIMFEFRVHRASGRFWFVEINPRYWASIRNALVSGVNFPKLHVDSHLHDDAPRETVSPTRVVESRFVMGEIKVAQELIAARRWRELLGFFQRHSRERLMFEDIGPGGLRTFLVEVCHALGSKKKTGNFGFQTPAKDRFFLDAYAAREAS